jgi:deoxyribose-phosphate aldolase
MIGGNNMNNDKLTSQDPDGMILKPGTKVSAHEIAKMIDHSLLKPEMTRKEVEQGCLLAKEYDCATVCVKPCDVEIANEILKDTDVLVTTVIGFPHGSNLTEIKVKEAEIAIEQGCKELDLVLNIGRLKSGDYALVEEDIRSVCDVAHKHGVIVKVIFENFYLTDDEKKKACELSQNAGVDFVKTSTGYAGGGATVSDLKLMREACSPNVQIKAAGGVRTLDAALAVRALGCTRFGATATKAIIEEARQRESNGTLAIPDTVTELSIGY